MLGPMTGQHRARQEFQAEIEEKRRQSQGDATQLMMMHGLIEMG